jgi:hypothetical protein
MNKFTKDEEIIADELVDGMFNTISQQVKYLDPVSFNLGAKQALLLSHKATEILAKDFELVSTENKRLRELLSRYDTEDAISQLTLAHA